jgi:hypothetical protein
MDEYGLGGTKKNISYWCIVPIDAKRSDGGVSGR